MDSQLNQSEQLEQVSFIKPKRKNQPGQGRKSKRGCKTKMMRVPDWFNSDTIDRCIDLDRMMEQWLEWRQTKDTQKTTARYYFLDQMLADYQSLNDENPSQNPDLHSNSEVESD